MKKDKSKNKSKTSTDKSGSLNLSRTSHKSTHAHLGNKISRVVEIKSDTEIAATPHTARGDGTSGKPKK